MADVKNKQVNIYIDQTAAETALDKLQTKADGFNKKIDDARNKQKALREEIEKVSAAGGSVTKLETQYKNLEKEITATTVKVNDNAAAMKKVQEQIDKGLRPSFAQQEKLVTSLRNQLKQLSEDAPGYAEKFKKFQSASAELDRMRSAMNGVEKAQNSWLQQAKIVAFGVLIGNTVQSALGAIGNYLGGIVTGNAKLSDSLADISKATNLSTADVAKLNSELSKIDTRTKTSDLREIAIGLGQVGEQANKLNVESIDKIVVALGDEFGGGAREITTVLSVLRNNLQDIKTGNYGDDILHIANALNVAGAEGLATAPVVTDISNRIAGVAQTFGVTSGQILGLASTFQELGIETERGSTAIIKLFQKIGAEPEKFAEVTELSVKQFKDLVNKDMVGAFELVAAGAKKAGSNNIEFAQILKDLDADGSGAGEVLSKLGANSELLNTKIKRMTDTLKENDSVISEFNIKNNTLAAQLEKLNKSFEGLIQSKSLSDFFASAVGALNSFIEALKAAPQWIAENKTGIYLIITGIAVMNASYIKAGVLIVRDTALKIINATTTKATALATNIATAAQAAYIVVTNLLTGKISLAIAAQRLWNIALSLGAGPIGIIIIAVGALIVGIGSLINSTNKLTAEQRINAQLNERISSTMLEEIEKIKELTAVIKDNTTSQAAKKQALQELIKINPEYLNGLTLENIKTKEGTDLINNYIRSLQTKAEAEAKSSLLADKLKQQADDYAKIRQNKNFKNTSDDALGRFAANELKLDNDALIATNFSVNGVTFNDVARNNEEIKVLENDLSNYTKKQIEDRVKAEDDANKNTVKSSATTIATLEKQLQDLQTARKSIDVNDAKALEENKQKIIAAQNELSKFEISTAKERNKTSSDARKKFQEFLKGLSEDAGKAAVPQAMEKIYAAAVKYFDDIQKLNAGKAKGFIDAEDYKKELAVIENTYKNTIQKLQTETPPLKLEVIPHVKEEDIKITIEALKKTLLKLTQDNKAGLQLDILKSNTLEKRRDGVIAELEFEKKLELDNDKLTKNERDLIDEEYRQKEMQAWLDYFQTIADFASQVVDIAQKFNQAKENHENAALNAELAKNDKIKSGYQKMLNGKLLTQNEYNLRVAALDAEADKKKHDLQKKQFERDKKIQIAQALINGAQAEIKTIATFGPPVPPNFLGILATALTIATTAAEISAITSEQPTFAKGGLLSGPTHADGGMPIINPLTGKKVAEVEGGEPILSRATYRNNKPAIDALLYSSMYQGGAAVDPAYFTQTYRPVAAKSIIQTFQTLKFASGGVLPSAAGAAPGTLTADPALVETLQQSQSINVQLMQTVLELKEQLKKGIKGDWNLKQLDDAYDTRNRIRADATFNS